MRSLFYSILIVLTFISAVPEKRNGPEVNYYLGFNLMPSANSGLVNYVIVYAPNGKIERITPISRQIFFFHATGKIESEANPLNENLFVKYEIPVCGIFRDSIFNKTTFTCELIDNLWKLRYKEFPYLVRGNEFDKNGWARSELTPSYGQMEILRRYGISKLDDYFYGEKAFRLLKDMQDPAWITTYMGS